MQINFLLIRDDSRNDLKRKKKFSKKSAAHDCKTCFRYFGLFFFLQYVQYFWKPFL